MERVTWLAQRRAAVRAAYDAEAPTFQEYPNSAQREWVDRLLSGCPPEGLVLDAPCGTGRYFPMVAAAGQRVVGIDQSAGMVIEAQRRGIAIATHQVGLQELEFVEEFDAAMTIDAMENVSPEDWPRVLGNLWRAVIPSGQLYLTVEETDDDVIGKAYDRMTAEGLPAVRGEVVEGDVAGYHYYPGREQVLRWIDETGWQLVDEGFSPEDGWAYRHLLLRRGD